MEMTATIRMEIEGPVWEGPENGVLGVSFELERDVVAIGKLHAAFHLKEIGRDEDKEIIYFRRVA